MQAGFQGFYFLDVLVLCGQFHGGGYLFQLGCFHLPGAAFDGVHQIAYFGKIVLVYGVIKSV